MTAFGTTRLGSGFWRLVPSNLVLLLATNDARFDQYLFDLIVGAGRFVLHIVVRECRLFNALFWAFTKSLAFSMGERQMEVYP